MKAVLFIRRLFCIPEISVLKFNTKRGVFMHTLTKTLTGAQIIVETLKKLDVDTIFGYPGGIVLGFYDELSRQKCIKHYLVRHEQAAVHAAEGYSRASGKCGAVIVTSGPGATNTVTGLANAYLDGYPLVVITGQVSAELLHQDAFQEVDIIDITKSCTKKNFQVKDVNDLAKTLIEAYITAMSGRQGPVLVDITKNVFSQKAEFDEIVSIKISKPVTAENVIKEAVECIMRAKRPLIISGGGIVQSGAQMEITKFSRILNIPVVSTMMGLGTYPSNDENYLGMIGIFGHPAANRAVKEADLIFAVGTRFNDRIRCCFKDNELGKKLIHLDINGSEISRIIPAAIGITGDAKEVLQKMIERLNNLKISDNSEWLTAVMKFKKDNLKPLKRSSKMHSFELVQEIARCIKDKNFIITTEVGQHQVWAARYLKFNSPRKFITSGGLGTMGFGMPAAIGAAVATNEPVICIAGDGSFQMNLEELAVCKDYNLPVKIFILNNGYLGMVRQFQEKMCDERYFATEISNPDFVKLAESYGIKSCRVEKLEDVEKALKEAFSVKDSFLVDFVIEPKELL